MIGIYLGEQNSGKTLAMSYFAKKYLDKGFSIYSNYSLKFPHKKINKTLLTSYVTGRKQFNKAIFVIDELYLILDARNFGREFSKMFSYFLLQTSKRDVHLLGTAQYFNTIEKRFRENTSFLCYCQRKRKIEDEYFTVEEQSRFIKDPENLYIKLSFIIRSSIDGLLNHNKVKTFFLKAKPIFDLYDTKELLAIE